MHLSLSFRHWSMTPIAMALVAMGLSMMVVGTWALPVIHAASLTLNAIA
jgi:hypothetical protein